MARAPTTATSSGSRSSGPTLLEWSRRLRASVVRFAQPGQLFEDLGITYIGVVPGHDLHALLETLGRALALPGPDHRPRPDPEGPRLPAGRDRPDRVPRGGAAADERPILPTAAVDGRRRERRPTVAPAAAKKHPELHRGLRRRADRPGPHRPADRRDHRRACRPAPGCRGSRRSSRTGSSTSGIAEQHAMTFATGLAMGGMRPVVALYSTFLQRAFDQTVHDVCQNDQPVLIAVDRAGLVGEDGTSHQGMFTLPAQRQLPEPRHRLAQGRAGAALAAPDGASPRTTRSPCTTRATRASGSTRSSPPCSRSAAARSSARAATCCSSGFGPIVARAMEAADAARGRGLVGRRHQRPVREAARRAADPRRRPRQAAGRDLRGERRRAAASGAAVLELLEEARLADPAYREVAGPDRRDPGRPVRRPRVRGGPPPRAPPRRRRPRGPGPRDARRRCSATPGPLRRSPTAADVAAPRHRHESRVQRAVPR